MSAYNDIQSASSSPLDSVCILEVGWAASRPRPQCVIHSSSLFETCPHYGLPAIKHFCGNSGVSRNVTRSVNLFWRNKKTSRQGKRATVTLDVFVCFLVVINMDAELSELSADDVGQTEDRIVSQWREVSADERSHLRDQFDEILRPLGLQMKLVVVERAKSLALFFLCLTLSALMSLRGQWGSRKLRDIVKKLFTFLSGSRRNIDVKRLTWPLTDYERCLNYFNSLQGMQGSTRHQ